MQSTNVELSKNELELVTCSEVILTKNRIIEKVYVLFGLLSEVYKAELKKQAAVLPSELFLASPKIYKGENYLHLPYVMLDYPRIFLKEDIFAVRSFFWWGNYFSITLLLAGKYLHTLKNSIELNLNNLNDDDYFICINNEPWQHHFEQTNYKALKDVNSMEEVLRKPFFKMAKKHSLAEWKNAKDFFENNYAAFVKLIM